VRVVSLLPAATEIVAALGDQSLLVGISHECDYPPSVLHLPRVTTTPIDIRASGAVIDAAAPHRVEWVWVKGHAGHPDNERADKLASDAAYAAAKA